MDTQPAARLIARLEEAQRTSGMSHGEFAASIGVSISYWSHIRRRQTISTRVLASLMRNRPDLVLPFMAEMAAEAIVAKAG